MAVAYRLADLLAETLNLSPPVRSDILLTAPKVIGAGCATLGDYYTFKFARQIYGANSNSAQWALDLGILSAWQWFCATRTFSNCVETTLTIIGLYNWPFHWALGTDEVGFQVDNKTLRVRQDYEGSSHEVGETKRLRKALVCASFAVILRPTNAIIWLTLILMTFGRGMYHHGIHWEVNAFIKESFLCGGTVVAISTLVDRAFYGVWCFPPWNFLQFNVFQSLAVFYGNNNWHYYLTQGYPQLLTVAIVPAMFGLYQSLFRRKEPEALSIQSRLTLHRLGTISVVLPVALSILSHKEVRFIYPILPILHILAAMPVARFMMQVGASGGDIRPGSAERPTIRTVLMGTLMASNLVIALFTSVAHNAGLIAVTDYFRSEFETIFTHNLSSTQSNLTFAVLMPCHSIPWRSHLQHPASELQTGISGWALTCEPPINLDPIAKANYLDEADVFYIDPLAWINKNMARDLPPPLEHQPGLYTSDPADRKIIWKQPPGTSGVWLNEGEGGSNSSIARKRRAWPDYIVFFQQLEPVIKNVLEKSAYKECKRLANTFAHDDWRRTGSVVVWCKRTERVYG